MRIPGYPGVKIPRGLNIPPPNRSVRSRPSTRNDDRRHSALRQEQSPALPFYIIGPDVKGQTETARNGRKRSKIDAIGRLAGIGIPVADS